MSDSSLSLFLAFGATIAFATSSLVYADYSRKASVLFMNCFKALVAFLALAVTIPLVTGWHQPSLETLSGLLLSGLIGLNIGDLFLLKAFTRLGVGRTLILFGFQPLFVGFAAYFLFDQPLNPARFIAVGFLVLCLFTFSLERFRTEKSWEVQGLVFALCGVALDTAGILLSRAAFTASPEVTPIEGHFIRCGGALAGFALMSLVRPIRIVETFRRHPVNVRALLILASLGGTYLSLILYLTAIRIGHLASVASIAITGPIFATALECLIKKKAPSRYLLVAFFFFCVGFAILLNF